MDIGNGIDDFGGAVSDLFGSKGASQAASAYGTAAEIAKKNEALTLRSTAITQQQQDIQTYKVLGTETADVAASGFTGGGSAGDLLRSSTQQAALSKQLIQNQGEITAQGFEEQAQAYTGQQQASQTQSKGSGIGGAIKAVAGVASIVGWVICTEFVKQHRLPRKFWMPGAAIFATYPDAVREGYFVWAVPSVRHIRAHPYSLYSRFLCAIFNWRAENIAAHAGVRGARKLIRGAAVTAVLWPLCYSIGFVRRALNCKTDWESLYARD